MTETTASTDPSDVADSRAGDSPQTAEIRAWAGARSPWPLADVTVDREEVTLTVAVDAPAVADDAAAPERAAALDGSVAAWREQTREQRITIARELEHRFGRKVAWSVAVAGQTVRFTHLAVPVMTRLRQDERVVLDTLVEAGVARSRSHALAWCVRLVGEHTEDWLAELRSALQSVQQARGRSPLPPA